VGSGVTPLNPKILIKPSQIPSSVENTSITTSYGYRVHTFANWADPLSRGCCPHIHILCAPCHQLHCFNTRKKFPGTPLHVGDPPCVQPLLATMQSSMKIVTTSIAISDAGGQSGTSNIYKQW
jgi:hypothetical protein